MDTRLLTLAVAAGKIEPATRTMILNEQHRRRSAGEQHIRVGEIAVHEAFLSEPERDELLVRQKSLRTSALRSHTTGSEDRSPLPRQLILMGLATLIVIIAALRYREHLHLLELTIVIVTFVVSIIEAVLQYKAGRPLSLSLRRAAFPLGVMMILGLVIFGVTSLLTMEHVPMHAGEHERIETITMSLSALVAAVIILLMYSIWKYFGLRYAESRLGAMKDTLIRVEKTLRKTEEATEIRKRDAIHTVLKGLRNALRLSPGDRIKGIPSIVSPSFNQTRVIFFVKNDSENCFQIYDAAYPEAVPDSVLTAFNWTMQHHKPALLNEDEFEKLKETARQANPKNWKEAYFNLANRHQYVSVCGWIYSKQKTLVSSNASQCLEIDTSYLRRMQEEGFDSQVLKWLDVGSFAGCPIFDQSGKPEGVLLAIKNVRNGFPPEDRELVIMAGQMLGRTLQSG